MALNLVSGVTVVICQLDTKSRDLRGHVIYADLSGKNGKVTIVYTLARLIAITQNTLETDFHVPQKLEKKRNIGSLLFVKDNSNLLCCHQVFLYGTWV